MYKEVIQAPHLLHNQWKQKAWTWAQEEPGSEGLRDVGDSEYVCVGYD